MITSAALVTMADSLPIFQPIFGADWPLLPPVLQQHYANRPFTTDIVIAEGQMEVRRSRLIRLLAPLLRLTRTLVPYDGADIPVIVRFCSAPDSAAFGFDREFHFPGRPPYHFRSQMVPAGGNEVIEYMRFGLGWRAAYRYNGANGVMLTHRGYVWRVGGITLPVPLHWLLGRGNAEEEALSDTTFRMQMQMRHPLLGVMFHYAGVFAITRMELDSHGR